MLPALLGGLLSHPVLAVAAAPPPPVNVVPPDPRSLRARTTVDVGACEHGPDDPRDIGRFKLRRDAGGDLEIVGWLAHNGMEHIDASRTAAWQDGAHVVSVRFAEQPYPEAPLLMCDGFSRLRIAVSGMTSRPESVSIYEGRLVFSEPTNISVD